MRSDIVVGGQVDVGISECVLKMRKGWMKQMSRESMIWTVTSIHNRPRLLFVFEERKPPSK